MQEFCQVIDGTKVEWTTAGLLWQKKEWKSAEPSLEGSQLPVLVCGAEAPLVAETFRLPDSE